MVRVFKSYLINSIFSNVGEKTPNNKSIGSKYYSDEYKKSEEYHKVGKPFEYIEDPNYVGN